MLQFPVWKILLGKYLRNFSRYLIAMLCLNSSISSFWTGFKSVLDDIADKGVAGTGVVEEEADRSCVTIMWAFGAGTSGWGVRGIARDFKASTRYQNNSRPNDKD
jgi:hypothetical protein